MDNTEQKREPKPWEIQRNVRIETRRFDTWEAAIAEYLPIVESGEHGYSKIKIVRRGMHRRSDGEYFELALFQSIESKPEDKKKGRRRKKDGQEANVEA